MLYLLLSWFWLWLSKPAFFGFDWTFLLFTLFIVTFKAIVNYLYNFYVSICILFFSVQLLLSWTLLFKKPADAPPTPCSSQFLMKELMINIITNCYLVFSFLKISSQLWKLKKNENWQWHLLSSELHYLTLWFKMIYSGNWVIQTSKGNKNLFKKSDSSRNQG